MVGYEVCQHRSSWSCTTHQYDHPSLSETAPTQGTLRVFPDVHLSNAYTILRPFFRPIEPEPSANTDRASQTGFGMGFARSLLSGRGKQPQSNPGSQSDTPDPTGK